MFIRLTKKDGSPIWFNAAYLVTVEPARSGGALVVPLGDGLDYEVRESAEDIIPLAEEAQGGAATPIAPEDDLPVPGADEPEADEEGERRLNAAIRGWAPGAPVFEAPEGEGRLSDGEAANAVAAVASIKKEILKAATAPRKRATRRAAATPATTPATMPSDEAGSPVPIATVAPPRRPDDAAKAGVDPSAPASAAPSALDVFARAEVAEPAPASAATATDSDDKLKAAIPRRSVRKTPLDLSTDDLDRIRRMAPKTVRKMVNSLRAQFDVADAEVTVRALSDNGVIAIDERNRVKWLTPPPGVE